MIALPPERAGHPAPPDLAERRAQMAAAVRAGAFDPPAPLEEATLAGLRCLCALPDGAPRGHMLQLHGGGFRIGRPEFEARLAHALAQRCGIAVFVPQYRLAPEHPFPAGLNDARAALAALRTEAGEGPLIVGGDSAGAGIAASLGAMAAAGHAPRIDALTLLSPWLDLTVSAPSYAANAASDALFSAESAKVAADLYLQGADAAHPLASPLFADCTGFPPTFISVGNGEVLRDDSLRFHARLAAASRPAELCTVPGMGHVAVVRDMALPGAAETFEALCAFIERALLS